MTGREYAETIKYDGTAITALKPRQVLMVTAENLVEIVRGAYDAGKTAREQKLAEWAVYGWGTK